MMIYILGITVLALHVAMLAATIKLWQRKNAAVAVLFAVVVWILPSLQIYFDSVVRSVTALCGENAGFAFFNSGPGALLVIQFILGLCCAFFVLKKWPNQSGP